MPYNTVCFYSFAESHTGALGGIPRRFRVTFSRLNWQVAPVEILPDGEPLVLEWAGSTDDLFEPTRALTATFNLTVTGWNPAVLNASGKYDIQVLIECDQTGTENNYAVFFVGWVQPGNTADAYGPRPNGKSITATDGLYLLKDKPVVDGAGRRLSGTFLSLASVLQFALAQTGYYRPLTAAVNLYHLADFANGQTIGGHPDPARCPLDRTRLKPGWLTTDKNEAAISINAIQNVLRPFGCRLGQWGGDWLVTRIVELDGLHNIEDPLKQSVLARRYNSPGDLYAGPGSRTSIDLRVTVGAKNSGEAVRVLSGSPQETLTSPLEAIRVEQDFGRYISEFPNGNLIDADADGLPLGWERRVFVPREAQRIGLGTDANPFQIKILGAGDNLRILTKQSIGVRIQFPTGITTIIPDFARSKTWTIKGRYQLYKARAMQMSVTAIKADGFYVANQSGQWIKLPSAKDQVTIRFDNAFNDGKIYNPTPTDFSITLEPIEKVTDLFIRFHDAEDLDKTNGQPGGQKNPDAYVLIWNLSLTTARDGLNLTGQTADRVLPGRVKTETVASLTLGDVPDAAAPYRHFGALFDTAGNATGIWREGRSTLAADSGKNLINTLADDTARQVMNVQPGFEGDVLGYLPYGPFSVLMFMDIGDTNTDGLYVMHQHAITRYRYRVRSMVNTITAVRIASDSVPFGPQPVPGKAKAYWQTPDGELLQSPDETTGQATEPTAPIGNPTLPALPPDLLDRIRLGLNLPDSRPIAGLIPSGSIGATLKLDSGTGAPPAYGIGGPYRPVPDNLIDYIDGPA